MLYRTVRSKKGALMGFFSTLNVVCAKPLGVCLEEAKGPIKEVYCGVRQAPRV